MLFRSPMSFLYAPAAMAWSDASSTVCGLTQAFSKSTTFKGGGADPKTSNRFFFWCIPKRCKAEDSRDGAPQYSQSEVVCSGAISNGFGASLEDRVCFSSTEALRLWSNHAGSFDRQQSFQKGAPSRLTAALIYREFFVHKPLWQRNPPN